jgi:hypothetical protein
LASPLAQKVEGIFEGEIMAIYPKAIQELIPAGVNDPRIKVVGTVKHVAVSTSLDIRPGFVDGRGIEAHFYVRFDGSCIQYRDTDFEADAQFAGNSWFEGTVRVGMISIETEGMGMGKWTLAQIKTLKEIDLWAAKTHGFILRPATAWNSGGCGYHSQFIQWNTNNHSCPGVNRIQQFKDIFIPWYATDPLHPKPKPDSRGPRVDEAIHDVAHAKAKPGSDRAISLANALRELLAITKTRFKKKP